MNDVGERFSRWSLTDYRQGGAVMRKFLADPGSWSLLIYGEKGTYKTALAAAAIRAVRERYPAGCCCFLDPEWARKKLIACETDWIETWESVPLLVWDDLGVMRDTPHLHSMTLAILRARYSHMRKTIITSNVDRDALSRAFDDRLADRLKEGMELFSGKQSKR